MRTRTRWASYAVLGVSCLWAGVVCLYSIGVDREQRRLAARLDALEARPLPAPCKCSSLGTDGLPGPSGAFPEPSSSALPPRLRVTGRSGPFRWAEFEFPDGYAARYYLATNAPPHRVRAWLDGIVADGLRHQPRDEVKEGWPEAASPWRAEPEAD